MSVPAPDGRPEAEQPELRATFRRGSRFSPERGKVTGTVPRPQLALLIVNSIRAYGGGEKWALQTARGLLARGHRIAIACREGSELEERARGAGLDAFPQPMPSDLSLPAVARLAHLARSWRPDVVL